MVFSHETKWSVAVLALAFSAAVVAGAFAKIAVYEAGIPDPVFVTYSFSDLPGAIVFVVVLLHLSKGVLWEGVE